MSVRATILLGTCLVGLMSIRFPSMGCYPVRVPYGRATVQSGYRLLGKCPSDYSLSGCILVERFVKLISRRATVQIPSYSIPDKNVFLIF